MLSIKDHIIISKYVYEFHKVNLNFKKNYHRTLFSEKTKVSRMFLNGLFVTPNPFNVYSMVNAVNAAKLYTATSEKKLEDYISLTRAPFNTLIKTWCDWCGMVNGYTEFLIQAINDYYQRNDVETIERGNFSLIKLKLFASSLWYLKLFAKKELAPLKKAPALTETDLFPNLYQNAPQYLQKLFELLTVAYNSIQEIEHIWCPFKYMEKLYCSAQASPERYAYYLKCEDFSDLIKAGELLFNFRHIKCNKCVDVLNERLGTADTPSPLINTEEYFKLICRLSRG